MYYNQVPFYNPYMYQAPKMGLFSRLARGGGFSGFLNTTSRTLNVINQAIPVINQVKPMISNARTMFRIANIMKEDDSTTNDTRTDSSFNKIKKEESFVNNNQPTFFL